MPIQFVQGDIIKEVKNVNIFREKWGEFNLVYSIGLADYLPDRMFKKTINFCFTALKPKGILIIAHKIEEKDPFAPLTPKWICDWTFNSRNEDDLFKIIKGSDIEGYKILDKKWDASNRIVFIPIQKNP